MPLPANPSDGQTALLNGISYVYDGAKGAWRRQATSITVSDFVVQGNLTLASNVESTSSSTGALVISGGLGVSGSVYSGGVYTNSLFYSNGSPYTVGGAGGGSSVPKITNLQVTDSSYVVLDDTAVDTAGGYIKITGTDFVSGCTVLIGSTPASSVTYISSTEVRAQVPATSAGTYVVYLVNPDGGVAIRVNGITFSGFPSWVTDSTLESGTVDVVLSIQLDATGASTYTLAAGSTLPAGLTLSNVGLLSGSVTGLASDITYNFTVVATDAELQDSPRAFSITINVNDEYFPHVTLLLDGEGPDGSQNNTFIDSSSNNFAITRNGNATQGSFSPYSANWSNYLNSSFLTFNSGNIFNFGTADWTIETWFYLPSGSTTCQFIDARPSGTNGNYITLSVTSSHVGLTIASASRIETDPPPKDTWVHLAYVDYNGIITIYINGVASGSWTNTVSIISSSTPRMGWNAFIGANTNPIYYSNLRVVKGTALYTGNFTPPTQPLTAIEGTSLLTCQSNRFIDISTNNYSVTSTNTVVVSNFSPLSPTMSYSTANNGGSGFFDGTGDYLTVDASPNMSMGTGDLTFECWIYATVASNSPIYESRSTSSNTDGFTLTAFSSTVIRVYTTAVLVTATIPNYLNTWVHVAFTRSGSTNRLFINGTLQSTATASDNFTNQVAIIGGGRYTSGSTISNSFTGYISNVRAVKGTALYTSDFVPPTAPLTAISGTSLLLNFTDAGVVDRSQQKIIETVGNAGISTAVKKYGSSSMYFDGSGDYLELYYNPNLRLGGNFTIEFWVNPTSRITSFPCILNNYSTYTSNGGFSIFAGHNSATFLKYLVSFNGSFPVLQSTTDIVYNAWVHLALVRNGSTLTLYVNGVSEATSTQTAAVVGTANRWWIGTAGDSIAGSYFNGYVDDLRVTNGIARYTANFTPPTGPHKLK